ncbi:MAG: response regulator [Eubacterium sp.]|nr:response regulator [Eubacterium sp.]
MIENGDIKEAKTDDRFLTRIRRQIRLLGFAAVGSLLLLGLLTIVTLLRSNINNHILNHMNVIANSQYKISNLNEGYYSSVDTFHEISKHIVVMRNAATSALELVYDPGTKNDIQNILRDVERLSYNYERLTEISAMRGYNSAIGLYREYTDTENKLSSLLVGLISSKGDEFEGGQKYIDLMYSLNNTFTEYTSSIIKGKQDNNSRWLIYGTTRSIEQNLKVDALRLNELKEAIPLVLKCSTLIGQMLSADLEYRVAKNNTTSLFSHLLSLTDDIRSTEEASTTIEQNSLLILIIGVIFILGAYLIIHTMLLRRDLSRSIVAFNELLVVKAANDAQSSFLSTVSHDIRTPINAIMGMNEIIIREAGNKQIERYALEIKDSSRTLLSLVNDLLDSSRLDADKLKIIPVEYDLSSSISDLANMISSRAREKNLNLFINVNEDLPHMLFGDEIMVKQCVLNLLTNAVKYTETGSITMNVDFETVNRGSIILKFQVIDTGIGMKEEDLAHLFERFSRFDEKKNRNVEGTGLGMNIVNRLLALMGTKLEVHSIYGKGSDFSFGVHQGVIDWAPIGNYNEMYEKSLLAEKRYHEKLHAPAARILIVDDMQVNLTVFKGLLKKTEIHIDTALSGKTAIELIKKNQYDIVFLDHRMPKMDGIETLINIRELTNNPNRHIPYIALTANAIAGARELYINAGFTDYLSKPIDSSELESLLIEYLPTELVELRPDYSEEDIEAESPSPTMASDTDEPATDVAAESDSAEDKMHDILTHLEGIDYDTAIANCIEDETLVEAISDFIQTLETKPAEIEGYRLNKDYRNYTIQVHALKSTARLIGATKLSEDAFYLEQCGDAENAEEIDAKTDALLDLYESYTDKLKPFTDALHADESADPGIMIDDNMFKDALSSVKELVDSFDFGNAEEVMKMLKDYHLTSTQQMMYDTLYKLVRNVDRDAVLKWFNDTLK